MYLYLTDHVAMPVSWHIFRLAHTSCIRPPRLASIVVHYMQEDNRLRTSHLLVLKVFVIILYF